MSGQPLARIKNAKRFNKGLLEVISNIKILVDDTIKYVDRALYVEQICAHINELIYLAENEKNIACAKAILQASIFARSMTELLPKKVPLALSHGDLQEGNIWVDTQAEKTFIIDWETNAFRSIWYDPATLLLSTRSNNGVRKMFANRKKVEIRDAILINDEVKSHDIEGVLGIVLLEDIVFRLEDNLELPFDWGKDNIEEFGKQLERITTE